MGQGSSFTDEERARLAPYFTDLDGHVFALTNLPETVKGALFARYSRSAKSLRRLFLDEFADKVGPGEAAQAAPSHGGAAVEQGERVDGVGELTEQDDAHRGMGVAQLGGDPDPLVDVRRRHADVREDDVGQLTLADLAQGVEVAHGGDDLHRVVQRQELANALADEQVVLSEHDADRHRATIVAAGRRSQAPAVPLVTDATSSP